MIAGSGLFPGSCFFWMEVSLRCFRPELPAGGIDVLAPAVPDNRNETMVQEKVPEGIDPFLVGTLEKCTGEGVEHQHVDHAGEIFEQFHKTARVLV